MTDQYDRERNDMAPDEIVDRDEAVERDETASGVARPNVPPQHRGDFAEGQTSQHVTTGDLMGDFAEGQETERRRLDPEHQHRGDFAEGQSETHTDPDARRGDFARGEERRDRPV